MAWFGDFFSQLTYAVGPGNPRAMLALYGLGALTDIGFPFPFILETFLFFTSYNVGPVSSQVGFTLAMLVMGRETGSAILYFICRLVGQPFLDWLARRIPRLARNIDRFRPELVKRSVISVVVVRLTPGLLQVPTLISGVMRLPYSRFALGVAIAALSYDFGLIMLGFFARLIALTVGKDLEIYVIAGSLTMMVVAWLILFLRFQRGSDKKKRDRTAHVNVCESGTPCGSGGVTRKGWQFWRK